MTRILNAIAWVTMIGVVFFGVFYVAAVWLVTAPFDPGRYRAGRFLVSEITAGASVVNGKLVLDGVSGEFLAKTGKEESQIACALTPSSTLMGGRARSQGNARPGSDGCLAAR